MSSAVDVLVPSQAIQKIAAAAAAAPVGLPVVGARPASVVAGAIDRGDAVLLHVPPDVLPPAAARRIDDRPPSSAGDVEPVAPLVALNTRTILTRGQRPYGPFFVHNGRGGQISTY